MLEAIRKCLGLIFIVPGLVMVAIGFAIIDLDMGGRLLEDIGDFIEGEVSNDYRR